MHPDPARGTPPGVAGEMPGHLHTPEAAIVPGADGEERVADEARIAVGRHVPGARAGDPAGDELALAVPAVEVVVARGDHQGRPAADAPHVALHDEGLGRAGDGGGDIEMVAGDHHEVDMPGRLDHPVELPKVIVQVGDEQAPQRASLPSGAARAAGPALAPACRSRRRGTSPASACHGDARPTPS